MTTKPNQSGFMLIETLAVIVISFVLVAFTWKWLSRSWRLLNCQRQLFEATHDRLVSKKTLFSSRLNFTFHETETHVVGTTQCETRLLTVELEKL